MNIGGHEPHGERGGFLHLQLDHHVIQRLALVLALATPLQDLVLALVMALGQLVKVKVEIVSHQR